MTKTDTNTLSPNRAALLEVARQQTLGGWKTDGDMVRFARAVLAKWGAPAPASSEPIAVSCQDCFALEPHTGTCGSSDPRALCNAATKARPVAVPAGPVEHDSTPLPAGMEPFGIWHEGETEDESDFYLFKDSGDVSCDKCLKLYTAAQVQAMLAQGLAPGWQTVPVEPDEAMIDALAGPGRVLPAYVGAKEKSDARLAERWSDALAAAPSGPAREPMTDDAIEAAWSDLQARRALKESADFNARIGLSCIQCGNGAYRADGNGYSSFHRCDKCHHVPMWKSDGAEWQAHGITATQKGGQP